MSAVTASPASKSICPVQSPSELSLSSMAAELHTAQPSTPQPIRLYPSSHDDDNDLSTIPDPRSRAMSPANGNTLTPVHHPDLNDEVAALSNKLINAINHQTTLDDTLSSTRVELDRSRDKVRQLEAQIAQQREMLAGDVWVRRKTVETEKSRLLARIAEEKQSRHDAEQQKKKIELELENLTAALFEEANKMVISAKEEARKEQEALQRKNDLLKAQLVDAEGLLRSQQEQLAELKQVIEQINAARDDQTAPTVPSSPGFSKFDVGDVDGPSEGGSHSAVVGPLSPSYPTSFTHLLQPVLRTDLASYNDFRDLIRTSKRLSAHRVSSGSHSGLGALGLGLGSMNNSSPAPTNGSNTSLSTTGTPVSQSSPQTPNTPASTASSSSGASVTNLPPLKDTKFYKRALAEDVEPTLRLDIAPGLSWLARRTVLAAMTDGSLVVEPVPKYTTAAALSNAQFNPCALCGDARKGEEHLRTHRFRTSESESAQRYPLCKYCLSRVRSTCDFLGFLRIVKDGHWRADDEDAERVAWEESVRLREQMFWSRIGGGVVPVGVTPSHIITAASIVGVDKSFGISDECRNIEALPSVNHFNSTSGLSEEVACQTVAANDETKTNSAVPLDSATNDDTLVEPADTDAQFITPSSLRNSTQSLTLPTSKDVRRLSLTIPGSVIA